MMFAVGVAARWESCFHTLAAWCEKIKENNQKNNQSAPWKPRSRHSHDVKAHISCWETLSRLSMDHYGTLSYICALYDVRT